MPNLHNKIYNAITEGIQKALLIDDQRDVSINYSYHKIDNTFDVLRLEFTDLGLPSGTLWCNHNLGAECKDTPGSWYGNYYAWGENEPKKEYIWETYELCNKNQKNLKFTDYNNDPKYGKIDNLTELKPVHDPIIQYYSEIYNSEMAKQIKMPTKNQCNELLLNTDHEWVKNYDNISNLNGMLFIGKNNNQIFIPAGGFIGNIKMDAGNSCYLWTSTRIQNNSLEAYSFYIDNNTHSNYFDESYNYIGNSRHFGFNIRGVYC